MSYFKAKDFLGIDEMSFNNPYQNIEIKKEIQPKHSVEIEKPHKIELKWTEESVSTSDPKVWGPPYWFSLHVSAAHYPENPSQIVRERMKNRILAIPHEISCSVCVPHAISFIENRRNELDRVVSNKHELGKFYVDFHNEVNKRYGKKQWTYDEAYKVYSGQATLKRMKY